SGHSAVNFCSSSNVSACVAPVALRGTSTSEKTADGVPVVGLISQYARPLKFSTAQGGDVNVIADPPCILPAFHEGAEGLEMSNHPKNKLFGLPPVNPG